MLHPRSLEFVSSDVEVAFEPGDGSTWTLWLNAHKVFMVTASKEGAVFYHNIFEDVVEILKECKYDNRLRRLVGSSTAFLQMYDTCDSEMTLH
jgi:hypothetical protein